MFFRFCQVEKSTSVYLYIHVYWIWGGVPRTITRVGGFSAATHTKFFSVFPRYVFKKVLIQAIYYFVFTVFLN